MINGHTACKVGIAAEVHTDKDADNKFGVFLMAPMIFLE